MNRPLITIPMSKIFRNLLSGVALTLVLSSTHAQQPPLAQAPQPPALAAKAWLLLEMGSGQVLTRQQEGERLEPASLTKLMTAYLTFTALRQKTLALEQTLPVSEKAWRTGGSKMFVKVGDQVKVDDLIKGMIVQSGNDACITLAEAISGSEEAFAQLMNREAKRLGMSSSNFMNSTGLPDPQHYTNARDLALLASALIRDFPEEYARYYSLKEFRYANITQPNRNRLLFIDPSVDGVKTGHTEAAGFCLIASAKRQNQRLLSVVLGTDSDNARATESHKLLNWGFQFYEHVPIYTKDQAIAEVRVWKGEQSLIKAAFSYDFGVAIPRGYADKLQYSFQAAPRLLAPIAAGQQIGTVSVTLEGKPYGTFPVLAKEAVAEAGWFGRLIDTIRLWFN